MLAKNQQNTKNLIRKLHKSLKKFFLFVFSFFILFCFYLENVFLLNVFFLICNFPNDNGTFPFFTIAMYSQTMFSTHSSVFIMCFNKILLKTNEKFPLMAKFNIIFMFAMCLMDIVDNTSLWYWKTMFE